MNDWSMMVEAIRAHYGAFDKIVPVLGMSKTYLRQIKADTAPEPRYSNGTRIIEVYNRIKKHEVKS